MNAQTDITRFKTVDPDEFQEQIASVASVRRVEQVRTGRFSVSVELSRWESAGLFCLDMKSMRVLADEDRDFIGVTVPVEGAFSVCGGAAPGNFGPGSAHVLGTGEHFDLKVDSSSKLMVANFFVPRIADYARRMQLDQGPTSLHSGTRLDLRRTSAQTFLELLWSAWRSAREMHHAVSSEFVRKEMEGALISALLFSAYDDVPLHSNKLRSGDEPRWVKRVEEYIDASLSTSVTLADIAEVAGVSARTVCRAFQRKHGCGPIGMLRQMRLEKVRTELLIGDYREVSVSEIAARYGFFDPGRFAGLYRTRFGESPSQTLRG